jgi:membrane fusion protein (multidrug efflux system)
MTVAFANTTRSLDRDSPVVALVTWAVALALLAAWAAWFSLDRVTVVELSQSARVEAQQSSRQVSALAAGRVTASPAVVGQAVKTGDILFELDSGEQRLMLQEEQTKAEGLPTRIITLQAEIADMEAARAADQGAASAALQGARFRSEEARSRADFAAENARRLVEESKTGSVSKIEAMHAQSQAQELRAAYSALAAEARRLQGETFSRGHTNDAEIESRKRELAMLQGDLATSGVSQARLSQTVDRFVVRAPVDGRIGELAPVKVGAYVAEGQTLASVVPGGRLIVVAQFDPASVQGRIRPGQSARLALDGYPWAQYGQVRAVVMRVSSDDRDGKLRVELAPVDDPVARKILKHGLLGRAEIEVERASPLSMVLRAVGQGHG